MIVMKCACTFYSLAENVRGNGNMIPLESDLTKQYHYRKAVYIRKCCGIGQNLNLRAGVCVDNGTREWISPPVFGLSEGGELVKSKAGNTILLDDSIRNEQLKMKQDWQVSACCVAGIRQLWTEFSCEATRIHFPLLKGT